MTKGNSGKGSSSKSKGPAGGSSKGGKGGKKPAKPAVKRSAAKPADNLENKVGGADSAASSEDQDVAYLKRLLAHAEARYQVEEIFWAYADGHKTSLSTSDRKALGRWAEPVKALISHGKCTSQRTYLDTHYINGAKAKDEKTGKESVVYKKSVGEDDAKALGNLAGVARAIVAFRKVKEEYDKQKADEAEAEKAYSAKRDRLMQRPYEILAGDGRRVEDLVADVEKKPADRKKLAAEMQKDAGAVFRTAVRSEGTRKVLDAYVEGDERLKQEYAGRLHDASQEMARAELYHQIDAVLAADPREAAKQKYAKPANGNGNGNGGKPKK